MIPSTRSGAPAASHTTCIDTRTQRRSAAGALTPSSASTRPVRPSSSIAAHSAGRSSSETISRHRPGVVRSASAGWPSRGSTAPLMNSTRSPPAGAAKATTPQRVSTSSRRVSATRRCASARSAVRARARLRATSPSSTISSASKASGSEASTISPPNARPSAIRGKATAAPMPASTAAARQGRKLGSASVSRTSATLPVRMATPIGPRPRSVSDQTTSGRWWSAGGTPVTATGVTVRRSSCSATPTHAFL